jgi:hypothetical protein
MSTTLEALDHSDYPTFFLTISPSFIAAVEELLLWRDPKKSGIALGGKFH